MCRGEEVFEEGGECVWKEEQESVNEEEGSQCQRREISWIGEE